MELFILINMAQIMYMALLSYVKSAMVSHGITVTNLCTQRIFTLILIEFARQFLFSSCFIDDETLMRGPRAGDSSTNNTRNRKNQSYNSGLTVFFTLLLQGILITVATISVLIGA